jgi:hypothetical protein
MARGLCKRGKDKFANFTRKGIANMRTGAILNTRVKVVVRDPEISMAKERDLEKEEAKEVEKAKDEVKEKEKVERANATQR